MKKLILLVSLSAFLVACNDNSDVVAVLEKQIEKERLEDEKAKEAMDMSKGATVYPITVGFGKGTSNKALEVPKENEEK